MERLVVVIVEPTYLHNEVAGRFAARIRPLGLTAYGDSKDAASDRLKSMFASAVETRRARGTLEKWLDGSELEWHWEDECDADMPIEYVGTGRRQSVTREAAKNASRRGKTNRWLPEFPMRVAA